LPGTKINNAGHVERFCGAPTSLALNTVSSFLERYRCGGIAFALRPKQTLALAYLPLIVVTQW
jgi:hypothetical protein